MENSFRHRLSHLVGATLFLFAVGCAGKIKTQPASFVDIRFPLRVADDLQVTSVEFGVMQTGPAFLHSNLVPYSLGQRYGWIATLKTSRKQVRIREELILPEAGNWTTDEKLKVSDDKRSGVLEMTIEVDVEGRINNFWGIAEGDPRGPHMTRLWIEGVPVAELNFTLR